MEKSRKFFENFQKCNKCRFWIRKYYEMCWKTAIFHQFERCNSNETCPFLFPNSAPMSQNGGEKTRKNFLIPKKVCNFLENVIFLGKSRKFFENLQKCNKCRFWIRKYYETRGTAPQRRRALVYYRISSHPIPITHHVSRHSHRTAYHSPSPGATDVFTTVAILACSKHLARFPFCKCRRVLRETYELLWFSDRKRGSNRDRTRCHRDRTATAPD